MNNTDVKRVLRWGVGLALAGLAVDVYIIGFQSDDNKLLGKLVGTVLLGGGILLLMAARTLRRRKP